MIKRLAGGLLFLLALFIALGSHAAPRMYVPTGETNELVIIDLATDKVIGRINELENAHGLSTSVNTEYLVAGSMQQAAPGMSKSAAKPSELSEEEHESHHGGDGNASSSGGSSFVSIVHPVHGHVMRRVPVRAYTHHTAVSPNGKTAIAVHSGAGGISVIKLDGMAVVKTLQTGPWPNYAVFTDDGDYLYVSNAKASTISEIDTQNWTITREFKVGNDPEHIVLGYGNNMLFTANKGDGAVSAVNLDNGITHNTYPVGMNVHGIDVSDDGRWLFAASRGEDKLTRVDLSNGSTKAISLSPAPYHLAYIKGQSKVYVSSRKQSLIWVIDPETMQIKNEINLGKGVAHQMVIRDE